MKRDRATVGRIIETRQAKRAASTDNAQVQIAAHKARMHEAETAGLLRTLARHVRRATTKPSANRSTPANSTSGKAKLLCASAAASSRSDKFSLTFLYDGRSVLVTNQGEMSCV
jgi:hypothetical protein